MGNVGAGTIPWAIHPTGLPVWPYLLIANGLVVISGVFDRDTCSEIVISICNRSKALRTCVWSGLSLSMV
jgi:hypothetical protein